MSSREIEIGEKNKVINQTLLRDIDKVEDIDIVTLAQLSAITVTLQDISMTLAKMCDKMNKNNQ